MNVHKAIWGISVFVLWSASGVAAVQPNPDVCPVDQGENAFKTGTSAGCTPIPAKDFTVPRKQVLMETATSVY